MRPSAAVSATVADSARDRLVAAAFTQFAASGFEATTVDDIAAQAGVNRRTFFRHFATKEDVVFPDHEELRRQVAAELERRGSEPPLAAVCRAVSLVMDDYVKHREVSLARFELTRNIVALRDREIVNVYRYQRLFARYLGERLEPSDPMTAEVMAASVVTVHNHVLREWLISGGKKDPRARLSRAFAMVHQAFDRITGSGDESAVAVFKVGASISEVLTALGPVTSADARKPPPRPARRKS